MSTVTDSGFPNLVNIAKAMDPGGKIAKVAEILSKDLELLEDIPWREGNLTTGHRTTARTSLPSMSSAWRQFNQGVATTKSDTAQFDETCGMLEQWSKVDSALANLNGNAAAYRAQQAKAVIEAMNEEVARAIFYESSNLSPEKIHGLSPRYASTTGYTASSYVSTGTVSGADAQSIWLINWAEDRIYGIFPKGTMAGLQQRDLGEIPVVDSAGKTFLAYQEQYVWQLGLCVEDYRYACRHQWDPGSTGAEDRYADSEKGLYLAMQNMVGTIKRANDPGVRFYMNRTSYKKLNAQLLSNTSNALEWLDHGGKRLPFYMGIPIRITDALIAEEALT